MNALLEHLRLSLRLHLRNRMALLYGYLFPLIFLVAFAVLYRHENVPLLRHMGELLTVAVLGGACFGLPTTLVSERERGVWRRYRLTPVPVWAMVASTALARYVIVLSAGLLQLLLALAIGMTFPAHPFDLWVAFTFVAFAFIGLGLVIAALADNVPAVQALGQCIFLPMLIIGGVAVQLAVLPLWAQHVSAFFPGRYAVEALQATVSGDGIAGARFSLLALALSGIAGCLAGGKLFRWDAQQRFAHRSGKAWLVPVFAAWLSVGLLAEWRGRIAIPIDRETAPVAQARAPEVAPEVSVTPEVEAPPSDDPAPEPAVTEPEQPKIAHPWQRITQRDVDNLDFNLPPDYGVVAPIADKDEIPDDYVMEQLDAVLERLPTWAPANEGDDIQRLRNLLYVIAVPDAIQLPVERFLPRVVFDYMLTIYPRADLARMLTWIATTPDDWRVIDDISELGIEGTARDHYVVMERSYYYAVKFVGRLTGRIPE